MNVDKVLALARKHLANDSARLCLADAVALKDRGDFEAAKIRALSSLRHSVGILHADFRRANAGNRMAHFDRLEWRARAHTRPATPGNNRAAIRETVALVERGVLEVNRDLVL